MQPTVRARPLTPRQHLTVRTFVRLFNEKGYPPTQRDVAKALGTNHVTVFESLRGIAAKGYGSLVHRHGWVPDVIETVPVDRALALVQEHLGPDPRCNSLMAALRDAAVLFIPKLEETPCSPSLPSTPESTEPDGR